MTYPLATPLNRRHISVLIVGYGNALRCDDGLGQYIANQVAEWQLSGVDAIAIHQLTPELSEELAHANMVIFVDASRTNQQNVQLQSLVSSHSGMTSGHWCEPSSLLAMTQALYGYHPAAWWVTVPGHHFEVGEHFSTKATEGIETALQMIQQLIETVRTKPCMKSE